MGYSSALNGFVYGVWTKQKCEKIYSLQDIQFAFDNISYKCINSAFAYVDNILISENKMNVGVTLAQLVKASVGQASRSEVKSRA